VRNAIMIVYTLAVRIFEAVRFLRNDYCRAFASFAAKEHLYA